MLVKLSAFLWLSVAASYVPYKDITSSMEIKVSDFNAYLDSSTNYNCYADKLLFEVTVKDVNFAKNAIKFYDPAAVCPAGQWTVSPPKIDQIVCLLPNTKKNGPFTSYVKGIQLTPPHLKINAGATSDCPKLSSFDITSSSALAALKT